MCFRANNKVGFKSHLDRVRVPVEVFRLPHDGLLAVELLLGHVEEVAVVVDQVLAHVSLGRRPGEVGSALKVETDNVLISARSGIGAVK